MDLDDKRYSNESGAISDGRDSIAQKLSNVPPITDKRASLAFSSINENNTNAPALIGLFDNFRGIGYSENDIASSVSRLTDAFTKNGISLDEQNKFFGRTADSIIALEEHKKKYVYPKLAEKLGVDSSILEEGATIASRIPGVSASLYATNEEYRNFIRNELTLRGGRLEAGTWDVVRAEWEKSEIQKEIANYYTRNLIGGIVSNEAPDLEKSPRIMALMRKLERMNMADPINKPWYQTIAGGTSNLLAQQVDNIITGGITAAVGAGVGFLVGGPVGAAAGASMGFKGGYTYQTFAREIGSLYQESLDAGMTPRSAAVIGLTFGGVAGALEKLQMDRLFPTSAIKRRLAVRGLLGTSAESVAVGTLNKGFKQGVATALKRVAGTTLAESAQESVQRLVSLSGRELGKALNGLDVITLNEFASDVVGEGIESLPGMLGMSLIGLPFSMYHITKTNRISAELESKEQRVTEIERGIADGTLDPASLVDETTEIMYARKGDLRRYLATLSDLKAKLDQKAVKLDEDGNPKHQDGIIREGIKQILGVDSDVWDSAQDTDEIAIPMSVYRDIVSKADGNEIRQNARKGVRQLALSEYLNVLRKQIDDMLLDPKEAQTEEGAQARRLFESVKTRLIDLGQDELLADDNATLWTRFAITVSRETRTSVEEAGDINVIRGTQELLDSIDAKVLRQLREKLLHVTNALFDEYDLSYVGSGEGAQAFGWGQYFATAWNVVKHYFEQFDNSSEKGTVIGFQPSWSDTGFFIDEKKTLKEFYDDLFKRGIVEIDDVNEVNKQFSGDVDSILVSELKTPYVILWHTRFDKQRALEAVINTEKAARFELEKLIEIGDAIIEYLNKGHTEEEAIKAGLYSEEYHLADSPQEFLDRCEELLAELEDISDNAFETIKNLDEIVQEPTVPHILSNRGPKISRVLNWELPIAEQPKKVKEAIVKLEADLSVLSSDPVYRAGVIGQERQFARETVENDYDTGKEYYYDLAQKIRRALVASEDPELVSFILRFDDDKYAGLGSTPERIASLMLAHYGIDGHRFYDGPSRRKKNGNKNYNYVIYNPAKSVSIEERWDNASSEELDKLAHNSEAWKIARSNKVFQPTELTERLLANLSEVSKETLESVFGSATAPTVQFQDKNLLRGFEDAGGRFWKSLSEIKPNLVHVMLANLGDVEGYSRQNIQDALNTLVEHEFNVDSAIDALQAELSEAAAYNDDVQVDTSVATANTMSIEEQIDFLDELDIDNGDFFNSDEFRSAVKELRKHRKDQNISRRLANKAVKDWFSKISNSRKLFQEHDNNTLGAYWRKNNRNIVALFEEADASTFAHEMGHIFLDTLRRLAQREGASEWVKNDWMQAKSFFGIFNDGDIPDVAQHERFANGFLEYLMTTKSPVPALSGLFSRFKGWLANIFKTADNIGIYLSPEVKDIYSHLISQGISYDKDTSLSRLFVKQEIFRRRFVLEERDKWVELFGEYPVAKIDKYIDTIESFYDDLLEEEDELRESGKYTESDINNRRKAKVASFLDKLYPKLLNNAQTLFERAAKSAMSYAEKYQNAKENARQRVERERVKSAIKQEDAKKKLDDLRAHGKEKMEKLKAHLLQRLDDYKRNVKEKREFEKMIREIKRMYRDKSSVMTVERRDEIRRIVDSLDMRRRPRGKEVTQEEAENRATLKAFMEETPDATDEQKRMFAEAVGMHLSDYEYLDRTPISSMTFNEFVNLYNRIKQIYELGRVEYSAIKAAREQRTRELYDSMMKALGRTAGRNRIITGSADTHKTYKWGDGVAVAIRIEQETLMGEMNDELLNRAMNGDIITPEQRATMMNYAMQEGERRIKKSPVKNFFRNVKRSGIERVTDTLHSLLLDRHSLIDLLDGGRGRFNGAWHDFWITQQNKCRDNEAVRVEQRIGEAFREKVAQTGFDVTQLNKNIYIDDPEIAPYLQGRPMTLGDMLGFYLASKDPEARKAAVFGNLNGVPDPEGLYQRIISGEFVSDKELWSKGIAFSDIVFGVLNDEDAFNRMNKVHIALTNKKVEHKDKYVSIMRLEKVGRFNGYIDPTLGAGQNKFFMTDDTSPKNPSEPGFTISRVKISDANQTALTLNPLTILMKHVQAEEHYIAFGEFLKQAYDLLGFNEGRNGLSRAIEEKHGKFVLQSLTKYYNQTALPSVFRAEEALDHGVNWLARNTAIASLSLNLGVAMKNFVSIPKWFIDAGPVSVLKSVGEMLRDPKGFMREVYSLDPQIMKRQGNWLNELRHIDPNSRMHKYHGLLDKAMSINSFLDRWVAAVMYKSVYEHQLAKGADGETARHKAQESVQRNMQPATFAELPDLWRQGGFMRFVLLFSSEGAKLINILGYQLPRKMFDRNFSGVLGILAATALSSMMLRAITHGSPDDDDNETWASWLGDGLFEYSIGGIPVVGDYALARFNGGYYGATNSTVQWLFNIYDGFSQLLSEEKRMRSGYSALEAGAFNLMQGAAIATGLIPNAAIKRFYDGIVKGENVKEAIQIILGNNHVKEKAVKRAR